MIILLPATVFFPEADIGKPVRMADSLDDVAPFCAAALSLPALFVAPVATRRSAGAPAMLLHRLFAPSLAVIAVRLSMRL